MKKSKAQQVAFKTNINCSGCLAKVTPFLNATDRIKDWEVNLSDRDKILNVRAEQISENEIMKIVEDAGFKIQLLSQH